MTGPRDRWTSRDDAVLTAMVAASERAPDGRLAPREWDRIATRLGRTVRSARSRWDGIGGTKMEWNAERWEAQEQLRAAIERAEAERRGYALVPIEHARELIEELDRLDADARRRKAVAS